MRYQSIRFYLPWYWPFWIFIFLFFLLTFLPYRLQLKLGSGMGRLIQCIARKSRKVAEINLKLCFPEKSNDLREHLLKESFKSLGIAVFETAMSIWASNKRLKPLLHLGDFSHLLEQTDKGRGVILLGAHFTTIEIAGRLAAMAHPYSVIYRPSKIAFVDFLFNKVMRKHFNRAIPSHRIREVVDTLKKAEIVWYSADVSTKRRNSVFAPFFGIQTATVKAVSRYAKLSGAAVAFVKHSRRADGSGYDISLTPILENFPSDDAVADATRINQLIEEAVRKNPEQYLWQYKRFKTRPHPSDKKLYS